MQSRMQEKTIVVVSLQLQFKFNSIYTPLVTVVKIIVISVTVAK
jgi:hypothetical protein